MNVSQNSIFTVEYEVNLISLLIHAYMKHDYKRGEKGWEWSQLTSEQSGNFI